jgi:hypothetical protein
MLQSKAHIIIIDGEVKSTSLFSILSFPVVVRNLAPKRFAILDGKLLELVKVGPSTPSSWFIDQIVRSGKCLEYSNFSLSLFLSLFLFFFFLSLSYLLKQLNCQELQLYL